MMPINLVLLPNMRPMTPDEFRAFAPPLSLAIDGFVVGGPWFDPAGPWANMNHHEGVDRLGTRATCEQALLNLRCGMFETFRDENGPCLTIFANDCDEDVCATVHVLTNPTRAESTNNLLLNRFISVAGLMDTTAGAYPLSPNEPILHELAWIFDPYRRFRFSGGLEHQRTPEAFRGVIEDVIGRIDRYLAGQGKQVEHLDQRYEIIRSGRGWHMVNEIGPHARTRMFHDRIHAFVSVREARDGRYAYTVGRLSPYIPFNVPRILAVANRLEANPADPWGGGETIGGSGRITGSCLTPDELFVMVEEECHRFDTAA